MAGDVAVKLMDLLQAASLQSYGRREHLGTLVCPNLKPEIHAERWEKLRRMLEAAYLQKTLAWIVGCYPGKLIHDIS